MVSAGNQPSPQFYERGYESKEFFKEGTFNHYVFRDISEDDCIYFCTHVPKICRYLLLERKPLIIDQNAM